jgi:DNA-binding transcriptional ArsR family regulator
MGERGGRLRAGVAVSPVPNPIAWGAMTADVLARMKFAPLRFVVPGILPEGMALLAGKPKFGKSFLAMDLAIAVASGGIALGNIQCETGDVLYCALEDSQRRLHDRLHKMLPYGDAMPARLHLETSAPRIGDGLIEQLETWLNAHPDARLVILDTWRCIKPETRGNASAYDDDASGISPLQRLTSTRPGLAVMVVHHTRKMEADDPFDTISGTHGLTGVADTLMVLARHGEVAKLSAQGRDLDGYEKAMTRDQMTGGWRVSGDARELAKTGERQEILDVLTDAEGETLSLAAIASATGKQKCNLVHLLKRLAEEGLVEKVSHGKYRSKAHSIYSTHSTSHEYGDDHPRMLNELNELNGVQDDD